MGEPPRNKIYDGHDNGGMRQEMLHAADAAKLPYLPETCPKCKATGPWVQHWRTSASCRRCGWTGYLKVVPMDDGQPFTETAAEKSHRMKKAAQARIRAMTREQMEQHMAMMKAASPR